MMATDVTSPGALAAFPSLPASQNISSLGSSRTRGRGWADTPGIGMGALCCCPSPEDFEEYAGYPNGCLYQNCLCLRCCVRWVLRLYTAIFDQAEARDGSSSPIQIVSSSPSTGLLSTTSLDSAVPDTFRAPPRPLPYDADPRYLRPPRDGLVSRRDKSSMSYQHASETEPLRRGSGDGGAEALTTLQRSRNASDYDEQNQSYRPDSPEKHPISKVESFQSLTDDEEICPTCLDGYNTENPKIPTVCGHHFHLSCIFEWQERSKHCPVCGQEMQFNESN